MIKRTRVAISKFIIHKVGNKFNSATNIFSESLITFDEESYELMKPFLLKSFANVAESFRFNHHANIELNEINNYTSQIFNDNSTFVDASKNIVKHLFEQSNSAQIKTGDVIIALFEDIEYKDVVTQAIGIFKIEKAGYNWIEIQGLEKSGAYFPEIKNILTTIKENKHFKEMYLFYEEIENKYIDDKETAKLYVEGVISILKQQMDDLTTFCTSLNKMINVEAINENEIYNSLDILIEKDSLSNIEKKVNAKKKLVSHLTTKKEIKESKDSDTYIGIFAICC